MGDISTRLVTFTGKEFDVNNPTPRMVNIADIAQSLSNMCRFNGHIREFYSVAEHCFHASYVVSPEFALEALLHDAAEAYISDVTEPVKNAIPRFRDLEQNIIRIVCRRFFCEYPLPEEVVVADMQLRSLEWMHLKEESYNPSRCGYGLPDGVILQYWEPSKARAMFLDRYCQLIKQRDIGRKEDN